MRERDELMRSPGDWVLDTDDNRDKGLSSLFWARLPAVAGLARDESGIFDLIF